MNEVEEIKIKMIEKYSNVKKKDVKEEYHTQPNRKKEGETKYKKYRRKKQKRKRDKNGRKIQ